MPVPLGTEIAGRYRLLELIGRGGMGVVYRARDRRLEIDVALKWIAGEGRELEAVRDEVRLARMVTHPAVCRLHDLVESEHGVWLSMEHVEGESLARRLERGALSGRDAMRLLGEIADGLAAAHAVGVVHRDLKPGNVLVREDGRAVIADFGIATRPGERAGEVAGSRGWMAPEQARGGAADARSDVYAFGALARAMLAEPPALIAECLAEDPAARPRDAGVVAARLRARPRRRWMVPVIVAGAIGAGVVGFVLTRAPAVETRRAAEASGPIVLAVRGEDEWLADVVAHLVVEELDDAWAVEAHVARGDATVDGVLRRDPAGRLVLAIGELTVAAESPRALAEAAAAALVEANLPAAARRPNAEDLARVGASSPLAWRLWRRTQRAARMQRWDRVRDLVAQAGEVDPGFPLPQLELALSFDVEEPAAAAALTRAAQGIASAPAIDPWWPVALDVVRIAAEDDPAATAARFETLRGFDLPDRERLQFEHRWALGAFEGGDHAAAVALMEAVAERWPEDAAATKALTRFHVGPSNVVSNEHAVTLGERAVGLAPHDVGARADWARALLVAGRRDDAAAQARIAERGDPVDRRADAVRLFQLHMALGDLDQAAEDARRLIGVPGSEPVAAACLAYVELHRGAFAQGLRRLEESTQLYQAAGQDSSARAQRLELGWQAFALGDAETARWHFALAAEGGRSAQAEAMALLAAHHARPGAEALAAARARVAAIPEGSQLRLMMETVLAHEGEQWDETVRLFRLGAVDGARVEVTYLAADAMEQAGRHDEAARLFLAIVEQPMSWIGPVVVGESWDRLGALRERAGDTAGAIAAYRKVTERWPRADRELPRLRHAQERLRVLDGR